MTPFTLSTGSYLGVDRLPEGSVGFRINEEDGDVRLEYNEPPPKNATESQLKYWGEACWYGWADLPPGQYSLIGENPLQLTEFEAAEIVESRVPFGRVKRFADYEFIDSAFYTALESYQSLLKSLGLNGNVVILKKK